jgi:GNAT superfamily N-acetyltransferase
MNLKDFWNASDVSWPPIKKFKMGSWTIREGGGGGNRVSATSLNNSNSFLKTDIVLAETAMKTLGQPYIFRIGKEEIKLDLTLEKFGYNIVTPSYIYGCDIDRVSNFDIPPITTFNVWPPLEIMKKIWIEGGMSENRISVMQRSKGEKTTILGRASNKVAGCAFVSIYNGISMVHSVFVHPSFRLKGLGRYMLYKSAQWAKDRGSSYITLQVTEQNKGARSLYSNLGMEVIGSYHYRVKF